MINGKKQGIIPSQRQFCFGVIKISSNFDSGNCSHATKSSNNKFDIWINGDHQDNNYRSWFYFSIEGIAKSMTVTFTIKNMQNQSRLLNDGLLPVYRTEDTESWEFIGSKLPKQSFYELNQNGIEWTFKHTFKNNKKHYFAMFYPWSNEDNRQFLQKMSDQAAQNKDIYFYWDAISKSIENRPVEFLVITSNQGKDQKKSIIDDKNIFVEKQQPATFYGSNKKMVVISARVHSGEVPSSHVMTGIIQTLISNTQLGQALRDNFVFYLFPILNPDGVGRGHYRVDTNGINLNRCYLNPSPSNHPSIYAIRRIINQINNNQKFFAFLDLHAHPGPRGNFIYGNSSNQIQKQLAICLLPKLLSLNSPYFQYQGSNFTEDNMYTKDKGDHLSKQASGRVAMYRLTKNPQCWTLQCGYNMSHVINQLQPQKQIDQIQPKKPNNITEQLQNINKQIICSLYQQKKQYNQKKFTISSYHHLGKEICLSFLDLIEKNPFSRIDNENNYFKSLSNLKLNQAFSLLRMSPNRFESNYGKIFYGITKSNNTQLVYNCIKAFYLLMIKNVKINNISNYIKTGNQKQIVFPKNSVIIRKKKKITEERYLKMENNVDDQQNMEMKNYQSHKIKNQVWIHTDSNHFKDESDTSNTCMPHKNSQPAHKSKYIRKTYSSNDFQSQNPNKINPETFQTNNSLSPTKIYRNYLEENPVMLASKVCPVNSEKKGLQQKVSLKIQEFKMIGIKTKKRQRSNQIINDNFQYNKFTPHCKPQQTSKQHRTASSQQPKRNSPCKTKPGSKDYTKNIKIYNNIKIMQDIETSNFYSKFQNNEIASSFNRQTSGTQNIQQAEAVRIDRKAVERVSSASKQQKFANTKGSFEFTTVKRKFEKKQSRKFAAFCLKYNQKI